MHTEFYSREVNMNELTNALRVANAAIKTVRVMNTAKKAVAAGAAVACCVLAVKFWRNNQRFL